MSMVFLFTYPAAMMRQLSHMRISERSNLRCASFAQMRNVNLCYMCDFIVFTIRLEVINFTFEVIKVVFVSNY